MQLCHTASQELEMAWSVSQSGLAGKRHIVYFIVSKKYEESTEMSLRVHKVTEDY